MDHPDRRRDTGHSLLARWQSKTKPSLALLDPRIDARVTVDAIQRELMSDGFVM
jgi:hypothetical protein